MRKLTLSRHRIAFLGPSADFFMHFLNASGGIRFLLVPYFGYTQLTPATVAVPLLVVALLLVWLRAVAIGERRLRDAATH